MTLTGTNHGRGWYARITEADRQNIDAISLWLRPVRWQWFVTLTFPWNVRAETADKHFRQFLATIQEHLRSRVCTVAGKERKLLSDGLTIPWHYHVLLTSAPSIPEDLIRRAWRSRVGPGSRTIRHPEGDSLDVKPYEPDNSGLEYCLKLVNDCEGDWITEWLQFFNPNVPGSATMNHKKLRQRRRATAEAMGANRP